jgi:class 3 adenylate cyclase
MFCDLVGSTPLSSKLDPEDLREVIAAYHRAVAEVVTRLDGLISRYMGDGVWFISATHKRMRIMPNGRYGLG